MNSRSIRLAIVLLLLSVFCTVNNAESTVLKKLEVTPRLLNINGPGGRLSISIISDASWEIIVRDKWIKCDTTKGKFSSTVNIKVEENFDLKARLGRISVISGEQPPVIVEIVQKGQHGE